MEFQAQFDGKSLFPYTDKDREIASELKKNQLVTITVKNVRDVASLRQLNLYWSGCTMFAKNTDHPDFRDKDMVSDQCKVELRFYDLNKSFTDRNGRFYLHYISIAFRNLKQIKRTNYINRAFNCLAEWMGIDVDTFIKEAKARCKRW